MSNGQFGTPFSIVGPIGPAGIQGLAGSTIVTGDSPPTNDLGETGDLFLDLVAGDLYYPKTAAGWPTAKRNLIGAIGPRGLTGQTGAALLNGYGQPDDTQGADGDSYFDSQNATFWGPKADGVWPASPISLIGPSGNVGATGTLILAANGAPDNAQGKDDDFFIDTLDGRLYGPKTSGSWGNGLSLIGPMGTTGDRGVQGFAGADGATILVGKGQPAFQLGKATDIYIDSVGSKVYGPKVQRDEAPWGTDGFSILGAVGPQGPAGPAGVMGSDGKTLLAGSNDPTADEGVDGDFYFNGTTGYLIGPKASGSWPTQGFLLKGPKGDVGSTGPAGPVGQQGPGFAVGSGAPTNDIGSDGSFYVDSSSFNIYGPKNQGNWPGAFTALIGPAGPKGDASTVPGPAGPQGPRGSQVITGVSPPTQSLGQDGDVYVDTYAALLYPAKSGGTWSPSSAAKSLIGPTGPTGAASTVAGPQGVPGYSVLTGSGAPSASFGNNGDVYIDLAAGALYGAKNSGSWPTSPVSLVGAAGAAGAVGATGAAGKDGSSGTVTRYGMGAPSASVGLNGDFYIDQQFSRLYGPKANSAWPSGYVSLVGPTGASGSLIITGNGAPSSTIGSTGDVYIDLAGSNLYGNKTTNGWPTTFASLAGATGPAAAATLAGSGAPASSLGKVGDIYVDTAAGNLYSAKTSSGWPSSYVSLVGPAGATGSTGAAGAAGSNFSFGTAEPGIEYKNIGDVYFRTTTNNLYYKVTNAFPATTPSYPNGWQIIGNLQGSVGATGATGSVGPAGPTGSQGPIGATGSTGAAGFSTQSGSGAPSSSTGNAGDIYVDTAAGNLYAAKSTSGWASSFLSLIGPVGPAGATGSAGPAGSPGATGATGPSSPGLRSGSGAPSSSNPSYQVDGDYYLRTDVSPYLLYGPRSSGAWPTSGQNTGGSQTQTGSGPPASTIGAVGDVYYDLTNALFYPPKQSSGWVTTPINMVGPTGAPGPTTAYRQSVRGMTWLYAAPTVNTAYAVNIALSSTSSSAQAYPVPLQEVMFAPGSLYAISAFTGAGIAANVTVNILKNGTVVYTAPSLLVASASVATQGYKVLPSGLTFAANDVITMTLSTSSATANQNYGVSLFYTTNS